MAAYNAMSGELRPANGTTVSMRICGIGPYHPDHSGIDLCGHVGNIVPHILSWCPAGQFALLLVACGVAGSLG